MLTSHAITTEEAFRELREEWNELLKDSSVDCLFLTWEWLYLWWEHFAEDRRLLILTWRREGKLVGIAPFTNRPGRMRRLLPFPAIEFLGEGNVGSDYLDLIIRRGHEEEVLAVLLDKLQCSGPVLQLSHVMHQSSLAALLAQGLQQRQWTVNTLAIDRAPYIDLREMDFEQYVAGLGSSHRANLRRRLRKLEAAFEVELLQVESEQQRATCLEVLVRLHLQCRATRGGSDALHTPALLAFHDKLTGLALQADWLRLFVLSLDGRPAAAFYCMFYSGRYYYYQTGYDPAYADYSVGLVGLALLVRQAIAEEAQEFDFLRGNESYKYLWANAERQLLRFDLFQADWAGRLLKQYMDLRAVGKRVLLLQR